MRDKLQADIKHEAQSADKIKELNDKFAKLTDFLKKTNERLNKIEPIPNQFGHRMDNAEAQISLLHQL